MIFNHLYLRDCLYDLIIQDCLDNKITSLKTRNYKSIQSLYDYTYFNLLAQLVYNKSVAEGLKRFSTPVKDNSNFYLNKTVRAAETLNKYRKTVMPEILTVALLTTDSFRWHEVKILPPALEELKNTFVYDFTYGLVEDLYEPLILYTLVLLRLQNQSQLLKSYLESITPDEWLGLTEKTKGRIRVNFNLSQIRLETLEQVSKFYNKQNILV